MNNNTTIDCSQNLSVWLPVQVATGADFRRAGAFQGVIGDVGSTSLREANGDMAGDETALIDQVDEAEGFTDREPTDSDIDDAALSDR